MKTNNFVTVLTFTYQYEVAVIRGRLESEGIECFVQDEFTVQTNPLFSNAVGGIKLQVRESDLERTVEILKEAGYLKNEKSQTPENQTEISDAQIKSGEPIKCPSCHSENVSEVKQPGYTFLISFLLLGFPFPFFKKKYHCFDCGHEFKIKIKNN